MTGPVSRGKVGGSGAYNFLCPALRDILMQPGSLSSFSYHPPPKPSGVNIQNHKSLRNIADSNQDKDIFIFASLSWKM